jgi:hypothetical protein
VNTVMGLTLVSRFLVVGFWRLLEPSHCPVAPLVHTRDFLNIHSIAFDLGRLILASFHCLPWPGDGEPVSTCRHMHNIWTQHHPAIIWHVEPKTIPAFDCARIDDGKCSSITQSIPADPRKKDK